MYTLTVTVKNPMTGDTREESRQFDPTTLPTAFQTAWNALGTAVWADAQALLTVAPTSEPSKL
jgi:hypothetical protein